MDAIEPPRLQRQRSYYEHYVLAEPQQPQPQPQQRSSEASDRGGSSDGAVFAFLTRGSSSNNPSASTEKPPGRQHRYNPERDEDKRYSFEMFTAGAGHQLDLNHLWQQVQELSAVLAANRENTVGLVKKADELRNRGSPATIPAEEARAHINGDDATAAAAAPPTQRELQLEEENKALKQELAELRGENEDLALLAQDYEAVLEKVLEGLRVYAHEHSVATINIHSSYTHQLANERAANAALRQREIEGQARLANLSTMLREAYASETALEPDIVIERLKAENAALRLAMGVEGECGEDEE